MTPFELGFLKQAVWHGVDEPAARELLKQALEKDYTEECPAGSLYIREGSKYKREQLYAKNSDQMIFDNLDEKIPLYRRLHSAISELPRLPERIKEDGFKPGVSYTLGHMKHNFADRWKPVHHVYTEDMLPHAVEKQAWSLL